MAKMASLGAGPQTQGDMAAAAPMATETHKSSAHVHAEDMAKMGMKPGAPGGHVEGMVHGVIESSHEHGMTMRLTHGALKHAAEEKGAAEKLYGNAQKKEEKSEGSY